MQIDVETRKDARGIDVPQRIRMHGHSLEVTRVVDEWHGKHHRYFKLIGGDGDLYLLRFDETTQQWDLTLFEAARAQIVSKGLK
jgi:hypothetical protein